MDDDDKSKIGQAMREAIRHRRGYADFFGWSQNRDREEEGVLVALAESLQKDEALFFGKIQPRGRGNDPPDLEALDRNEKRIAFEITELVAGEAIKASKSTKLDEPAEWTERGFLDRLGSRLQSKNARFTELKDPPYDGGYVVVVFSDEPDLSAPVVERYLRGQSFTGTRLITRAFFLISYDPRLDRCPYFELGVGA
jgi:hypothetical protein